MRFLFSVVYAEVQRSCLSLTRVCFDASPTGWVSRMFERVGGAAFRDVVHTLRIEDEPLEPGVLGDELAGIFGDVRTVRRVSREYSRSPVYGAPTPLALYLPARVILCVARMVGFYVDHCAGREVGGLRPRELIHHAAVLGVLFWVRRAGHIDSVRISSAITVCSAGPLILARLRESLARYDEIADSADRELYGGLRFWVLYVGAQEEQGRARKREVVEKWFTDRLMWASVEMGMYTWQQARLILKRYPPPDAAEPHGSTWFEGIFPKISRRSTGFEGVFARNDFEDTDVELSDIDYERKLEASEDDGMTWSHEQVMELEKLSCIDEQWTYAIPSQSVQPKSVWEKSSAYPSWDVGQDRYWVFVSESQSAGMREKGEDPDASRGVYLNGSGLGVTGSTSRQPTYEQLVANSPQINEKDDAGWGWSDRHEQAYISATEAAGLAHRCSGTSLDACMTTNMPLPTFQSHLCHSSAPGWQSDCRTHTVDAIFRKFPRRKYHSYTSRMNDPKLTGIETGPVRYAMYPVREMDERESLAEARKYEFF